MHGPRRVLHARTLFFNTSYFICFEEHLMSIHCQFNGILRECCDPIKIATRFKGIFFFKFNFYFLVLNASLSSVVLDCIDS